MQAHNLMEDPRRLATRADSTAKRGEERMLDIGKLAAKVSSDVYAAAVKHFEEAEHAGLIIGNGHHMAQDIAEKAKNLLRERHRKTLPEG